MKEVITHKYLDELTYKVLGCAIEVHKFFGRGLLESVYQKSMEEELKHRKINFLSELKIPVVYKSKPLDIDFRCDFFIENCLVVELKSCSEIHPTFKAQLLNYLKLLQAPKGILINFNCSNIFKEGQKTFINEYFNELPHA